MKTYLLIVLSCLPTVVVAQLTPRWSFTVDSISTFCSPQVADLTGDGILDIVIGGGLEKDGTNHGILALDGRDGALLWEKSAAYDVYMTPLFQDITNDGIVDVFIGGRNAQLFAIDGKTGATIWTFNPQVYPPIDMDQIIKQLTANRDDLHNERMFEKQLYRIANQWGLKPTDDLGMVRLVIN